MSVLSLNDTWLPLSKAGTALTSHVELDVITMEATRRFDYAFDGKETFEPWAAPTLPSMFGIGAIVGKSGSGKSTLLRDFGTWVEPEWSTRAIASHFDTADEAASRFYAAGLSSVPAWCKPFDALSNGERFRANLARCLVTGAVIDEFTSVVDRNVAAGASRALRSFVSAGNAHHIVIATVHRDVLPWLEPEWIIDTDTGMYCIHPRECLQRSPMVVEIHQVDRAMWSHFAPHHYLNGDLHPFARCYIATVSGEPAAFGAAIPFPHATIRRAWRGTRLVTLPDFQGLGIGPRLADWIAEAHARAGYGYYVKTTHPRLGKYRDAHPHWQRIGNDKPSLHRAVSFGNRGAKAWRGSTRVSYSHRFIMADDSSRKVAQ